MKTDGVLGVRWRFEYRPRTYTVRGCEKSAPYYGLRMGAFRTGSRAHASSWCVRSRNAGFLWRTICCGIAAATMATPTALPVGMNRRAINKVSPWNTPTSMISILLTCNGGGSTYNRTIRYVSELTIAHFLGSTTKLPNNHHDIGMIVRKRGLPFACQLISDIQHAKP